MEPEIHVIYCIWGNPYDLPCNEYNLYRSNINNKDNKIITIFDINSFLQIFEIHNINDSISPWEFEYICIL